MNIDAGERFAGRAILRDALEPAPRWLFAIAAAILVFVPVWAASGQTATALLAGWDAGILTCLLVTYKLSRAASRRTLGEEAGTSFALIAITIAAAVGLAGALALAGGVGQPESSAQAYRVGLAMAAVVESWLLVRTECRLHFARLRGERKRSGSSAPWVNGAAATPTHGNGESPDLMQVGVWEFIYYAFPVARLDDASDPGPITPAMCRVAILQSVMTYASVIVLVSFGLSLIGPGLDAARIALGG